MGYFRLFSVWRSRLSVLVSIGLCVLPNCVVADGQADVIVYGSTPGGFCAAIAAAREGAKVILLEPTNHVGGVNTGGLSFSDSNQTVRSTVMGLFDEWHARIEEDYTSRGIKLPYKVSVKDQSKWTYEPHVAARVTRQMLDEAKVEVLTGQYLKSVTKEGSRIVELVTVRGSFRGKCFIDCTYEGDLMAAAGVSWTIGRESRTEYGESLAGKQFPKKRMEINGTGKNGDPLPFITAKEAGVETEGDSNVMVYSFRLCLTEDPANRVDFPEPENYDPALFEVMRRYLKSGGTSLGVDLYPLPGKKFDGNNSIGGQFSLGLVGACNGWSEADEAGRAVIWEEHKQYTLEFYKFLTTDAAVPEDMRKKYSKLGLCKDEFPEYGHFSPQLYVREGRRMKGMYVVSQKDIIEEPEKEDPIVISSFPIDSHDCQRVVTEDGVINEGTIFPVRMEGTRHGYPYHIPYRAILPHKDECSNLLVPVALSCTHVAISSIRVEPTWMILGQSAGIAAALSAKDGSTVQEVPYSVLKDRLLAQGQVLELPDVLFKSKEAKSFEGIVLDDPDAITKGKWSSSTNFDSHVGKGYRYAGGGDESESTAEFRFTVPKSGRYELRMSYSPHETRAKNVPITIESGAEKVVFKFDQTIKLPAGLPFRKVGVVTLTSGMESKVTVGTKNADGFVILDALQFVELKE